MSTPEQDGPHIAVLAEYDALPGLGHACGHNVICTTAAGGFLGAATVAERLGGRVSLIGTPAEEGGGGKEILARAGVFDDVDAVIMLHPFSHDVALHPFLGRRQLEMVFHGVGAHASAQPFMGRNALDAAVAAYQGVSALRQQLPQSDRVHGVFSDGGARPNVIPARAALLFYLRSQNPDTLRDLAARMTSIAEGAAAMTGCGVELIWDAQAAYLPIRFNTALAGRWSVNQAGTGRKPLPPGIVPESLTGSTDLGNLSYRMPALHPMLADLRADGRVAHQGVRGRGRVGDGRRGRAGRRARAGPDRGRLPRRRRTAEGGARRVRSGGRSAGRPVVLRLTPENRLSFLS